jgi:ribosomal protein S19
MSVERKRESRNRERKGHMWCMWNRVANLTPDCVGVSVLVHNFSNFYSLMEMIRTYIGVDVGTKSARAAIFDQKGWNSKTDKLHSFTQNYGHCDSSRNS